MARGYTVKSRYQVLKQDKMAKVGAACASSSHNIDKKLWNVIWYLKVHSKESFCGKYVLMQFPVALNCR